MLALVKKDACLSASGVVELTEAPNQKRNEGPCPMTDQLIQMDKCRHSEQDGEEDGCRLGWIVSVVRPDCSFVILTRNC
jgi:hypothetical protein